MRSLDPGGVAEVGAVNGADVANGAVVDLLEDGALGVIRAPAEAGLDAEILAFCLGGGGDDVAHARGVGGHGLFAEDVLAGGDGFFQMLRAEAGGCGEDDDIDVGGEHLIDGFEADEFLALLDLHLIGLQFADVVEAGVEALADDIAHGGEDDVFVGGKGVAERAGAATAAADDPELERLFLVRADDGGEAQNGSSGDSGGGAGEERAAIEGSIGCVVHGENVVRSAWKSADASR